MPRRPPARIRAQQTGCARLLWRPRRITRIPRIPGASGALQAAVVRLEMSDPKLSYGSTAEAFIAWKRLVHGPLRQARTGGAGQDCDCCDSPYHRELLDLAMRRLPKRSARELRRLLEPLDQRFLERTVPIPGRPDGPWWTYRC